MRFFFIFFICAPMIFSCSNQAPTVLASTGEIRYCNLLSEIMACFIDIRLRADFDSCLNSLDRTTEEIEGQLERSDRERTRRGQGGELDEELSFNYREEKDQRRFIEYRNDINQCKSDYRYRQGQIKDKEAQFLKNCSMDASYDLDELLNCSI